MLFERPDLVRVVCAACSVDVHCQPENAAVMRELHASCTAPKEKRPYSPPTLKFLGTASDVTRGIGGASPDASSQTKDPMVG